MLSDVLISSVVEPEPEPQERKLFASAEPKLELKGITVPDIVQEPDPDPT